MKIIIVVLAIVSLFYGSAFPAAVSVYKYHFPKVERYWGDPVSFNNLSPGFFQVMFKDAGGVIRIATYGIAGGSMDTLKDPQLLMVFVFDEKLEKVSLNNY